MASTTRLRERLFAGFGAVLFLGSAVAFTAYTVFAGNSSSSTPPTPTTNTSKSNAAKLAGTQLAGFTPVAKVDALQIIDTIVGTGPASKASDTISVDYTGAVASNGTIFQSSLDTGQPVNLSLAQVIQGWKDGIPGMKVGGVRRLVIPAAQAYGSQAQSGIPANSDLVFDITLHNIVK